MAGYIPEDKISEIRSTVNIVDVISEVVFLKKAGNNYLGLCPFHSEKTPSFTVSPEKQIFYCFGCGAGGNVFSFLMKHEGISFPESVRMLARRCGIEISGRNSPRESQKHTSEKEALLEVNRAAAEYFHQMLCTDAQGKSAMHYLMNRKILEETCRRFQLGFAPDRWDTMARFFSGIKKPLALVEKSGLIISRKDKPGFYDRFRNRIIFPIFNASHQVVGFGGRVLDDALPKYLNSPDTPVFNKSRLLYGLHVAKSFCREQGSVYIVEGYFDLIALHQNGICNAVATLGTALTTDHLQILKGFARRVNLVYDSDQAGIQSAERCVGLFLEENIDARVVVLPANHDPDSFLGEFGREAFLKMADDALGVMTFLIHTAVKKHGLSIEGRTRIIADLKVPLSAVDDSVARSVCVKEISERIGVSEAAILETVRDAVGQRRTVQGGRRDPPNPAGTFGKTEDTFKLETENRLERHIITMMIQFPEMLPDIRRRRILDGFENTLLGRIGHLILDHVQGTRLDVSDILAFADNSEQRSILTHLAIEAHAWDREGCLRLLSQYELSRDRRKNVWVEKIKAAEQDHDDDLVMALLRQKQELIRKKH